MRDHGASAAAGGVTLDEMIVSCGPWAVLSEKVRGRKVKR